jgi:hypothetical protein
MPSPTLPDAGSFPRAVVSLPLALAGQLVAVGAGALAGWSDPEPRAWAILAMFAVYPLVFYLAHRLSVETWRRESTHWRQLYQEQLVVSAELCGQNAKQAQRIERYEAREARTQRIVSRMVM